MPCHIQVAGGVFMSITSTRSKHVQHDTDAEG